MRRQILSWLSIPEPERHPLHCISDMDFYLLYALQSNRYRCKHDNHDLKLFDQYRYKACSDENDLGSDIYYQSIPFPDIQGIVLILCNYRYHLYTKSFSLVLIQNNIFSIATSTDFATFVVRLSEIVVISSTSIANMSILSGIT